MHIVRSRKRRLVALASACALSVGAVGAPVASAQSPIVTGGLVNVTIVDFVDVQDVVVQLPVAVAANVCDVDVNVLAADLADDGQANCTATATSRAKNR